jgi:hypothetical protein
MNTTTQQQNPTRTTNMASTRTVNNPYAKSREGSLQNGDEMGRQSQQRNSQQKRAFALATANNSSSKKRKGDQGTLLGGIAFEAERDCVVCKARSIQLARPETRIPKRPHHVLCRKNSKTKCKGNLSQHALTCMEEEKRLNSLYTNKPLEAHEKGSWKHSTKEAGAAFFAPRKKKNPTTTNFVMAERKVSTNTLAAEEVSKAVSTLVKDSSFCKKHKDKCAPLAMIAFAEVVAEKMLQYGNEAMFWDNFDGLGITVPTCTTQFNPHYHSITGSKLLLVDWKRSFRLEIDCPDAACPGKLDNDQTNFSKNKTLFPIFSLAGQPTWCMVMSMVCTSCCKRRFDSNTSDVLLNVPPFAASHYPVDTHFACHNTKCHLSKDTTEVFGLLMVTYANWELCSKMLYNALNRAYLERIEVYLSLCKEKNHGTPDPFVDKDGGFIKQFSPLGDTVRDMFDAALSSSKNRWGISDHDRYTRELQSVKCKEVFTQDHTFEM